MRVRPLIYKCARAKLIQDKRIVVGSSRGRPSKPSPSSVIQIRAWLAFSSSGIIANWRDETQLWVSKQRRFFFLGPTRLTLYLNELVSIPGSGFCFVFRLIFITHTETKGCSNFSFVAVRFCFNSFGNVLVAKLSLKGKANDVAWIFQMVKFEHTFRTVSE